MKFVDSKDGLRFAVNGPILKKEDIGVGEITEWGVPIAEEITIMVWNANDNCHLHMINDTL